MQYLILAFAAVICFFVVAMAVDCNRFVVRNYSCRNEKLKKPLTIVQLSDLHNKQFGKKNQKLLNSVRKVKPDLIILSGDMYTSLASRNTDEAQDLVTALARSYPVYYSNGNHEQKTKDMVEEFGTIYEDYQKSLTKEGVCFLSNESIYLAEYNIRIYGLELSREYYRKFKNHHVTKETIRDYLGESDEDAVSLMIAHNPEFFPAYADWKADFVFAGHVHGGLMKLPFAGGVIAPSMKLFPKYDGGVFHEESSTMILSRGLGTHTLPIRIFNPGELVVLRLTP